jgi:hypothetical protein
MAPTNPATAGARRKVHFPSGDTTCAAWHYPGTNGGCVIMAGGLAVTKEPGTDRFARRFHEAGSRSWPSTTATSGRAGASRGKSHESASSTPTGRPRSSSPAPCPRWTPPGSRSGASPPQAVTSSPSRLATRDWQPPSRNTPLADGQAAMPNALRHQTPIVPALHRPRRPRRGRRPPWPGTPTGAARRRAWHRHIAHHARCSERCPSAQPCQPLPGLAASGRRPLGAARWLLPAGPLRVPRRVSPAGARLRPGWSCASGSCGPRQEAGAPAERSSACPAGTTSPSWTDTNKRSKSSFRSCVGICLSARHWKPWKGDTYEHDRRRPDGALGAR